MISYTLEKSMCWEHNPDSLGNRRAIPGWLARLNCRTISFFGATKHEAIEALINGVARLVKDGHLDPYSAEDTASR